MENFKKEFNMRQLLINSILLIMISCKAQIEKPIINSYKNQNTMEKLDLTEFKKGNYVRKDGDFVQQFKSNSTGNDYLQNISSKTSPVEVLKQFHPSTILKKSTQLFYRFPVGLTKEYDEKGKLLKEVNNDEKYSFTVEQLCKLVIEEYGVNLMIKSYPNNDELQYTVTRQYINDLGKNCYIVTFSGELPDEGEFYARKNVCVDGVTGKIIYEEPFLLNSKGGEKIPRSKTSIPQKK